MKMQKVRKKERLSLSNVYHYLIGNFRYKLFYSKHFKWLIRPHIREQIAMRIAVMDVQCYNEGSCKLCGCETTALQMANKSCNKPCYPPMMGVFKWKLYQMGFTVKFKNHHSWKKHRVTGRPSIKDINSKYVFTNGKRNR